MRRRVYSLPPYENQYIDHRTGFVHRSAHVPGEIVAEEAIVNTFEVMAAFGARYPARRFSWRRLTLEPRRKRILFIETALSAARRRTSLALQPAAPSLSRHEAASGANHRPHRPAITASRSSAARPDHARVIAPFPGRRPAERLLSLCVHTMTWDDIDWRALDRLREGFLHGGAASGPYWQSASDLASYDLTYGERIGWKWDAVLHELRLRGWSPPARIDVLDWGCGSGIAARRVLDVCGAENFASLTVWDHSPLAMDFAARAARQAYPSLDVVEAAPGFLSGDSPVGLLLISHVLNELSPSALDTLLATIDRAAAVIWVEPGTRDVSRQLSALHDRLLASFRVVAPCTHQLGCPMLLPGNTRHWCHFFAPPPVGIFADSQWVKFGQRAGIDLRSLPYSFLALDRRAADAPATLSRVIGRPEHFKPYVRLLNCDATGLTALTVPKRTAPQLYKELDRTKAPLVYHWQRVGDEIHGAIALADAR